MPGTFTPKVLADGQLATTKTVVFTATTATYVKSLTLFNDNAAEQTVLVYLKPGATSRKARRFVLTQNEHANAIDPGEIILLESGDEIEAQTTTASAVDFVLMGVEET